MKIELWSKTKETEVCRETKDSTAGAPYQVAHMGKIITVTRRCATAMFKAGMITGVTACRGPGGNNPEVRKDMMRQRLEAGGTLTMTVKPSGKAGTFMLSCPEMQYEAPTKDPAREMMLLATEWWELIDHGDGSLEAELAGEWQLQH